MPTKFTCQFTMDSAAFHDVGNSYGEECAEILCLLAGQVQIKTGGKVRDINGNTIGKWAIR